MAEATTAVVVEDDPDISDLLVWVLQDAGLVVSAAATGAEAVALIRATSPDLVTLDLSLPDADGTDVCRELRTFSDAYIMMITGRDDEVDRLVGLEVGADDYLVKPFSPQEVRARVAALLRRPRGPRVASVPPLDAGGGLVLIPATHAATLDAAPLALTPTEVDLLHAVASQPGRTWSRAELVTLVWQGDFIESEFLVDIHVGSVRRKLRHAGSAREWIETVGGTGYRFAVAEPA